MIRYRTGMDRRTGRTLTGWPHVAQSLDVIWGTQLTERVLRLDFGSDLVRLIGRPMAPQLALDIYRALVTAAHRHEPEYRVRRLDVVKVERTGTLGVRTQGLYFPEGRFGNYKLAETAETLFALARGRAA